MEKEKKTKEKIPHEPKVSYCWCKKCEDYYMKKIEMMSAKREV